jgi:hypothetical protein
VMGMGMGTSEGRRKIGVDMDKELIISAGKIEFEGYIDRGTGRVKVERGGEVAIFEHVSAVKSIRVVNDNNYIDLETLRGSVKVRLYIYM